MYVPEALVTTACPDPVPELLTSTVMFGTGAPDETVTRPLKELRIIRARPRTLHRNNWITVEKTRIILPFIHCLRQLRKNRSRRLRESCYYVCISGSLSRKFAPPR